MSRRTDSVPYRRRRVRQFPPQDDAERIMLTTLARQERHDAHLVDVMVLSGIPFTVAKRIVRQARDLQRVEARRRAVYMATHGRPPPRREGIFRSSGPAEDRLMARYPRPGRRGNVIRR